METHRPQQVVVADDFTPASRAALDRAVEIVCRAPWHVLHVVTAIDSALGVPGVRGGKVDAAYADTVHEAVVARVQESFAGREASSEVGIFVHARIGKPAEEILAVARDVGADLIIVGSHSRRGVNRLVLGSVSEAVVREAECAVMVARPKAYREVQRAAVFAFEHPIGPYTRPHRYAYADQRVLHRPTDWPLL